MSNENKRMQKLAGINEITVNNPSQNYKFIASKFKIPNGWNEREDLEDEDNGNKKIIEFSAPMEGWDTDHDDYVWIEKTPGGTFIVNGAIAYGEFGDDIKFDTFKEAMEEIIRVMNNIKNDWDEYYEDEEDLDDEF